METKTLAYKNELRPKDIVQQLLEIAKNHNALDEIGGATSWRWQEGIISRMPKINTVAKVLKRAYDTDDPQVWIQETTGQLKDFLCKTYSIKGFHFFDKEPQNIYEALIFLSLVDDRGFRFDEMVIRLSFLKYSKHNDVDENFLDLNEDEVLISYGKWAKRFLSAFIEKSSLRVCEKGFYRVESKKSYTGIKMALYQSEIMALRNKLVEGNSSFDLSRTHSVALTDCEMIEIEHKLIDFYKSLVEEIESRCNRANRNVDSMRTRLFSVAANSLRSNIEEELVWK